MKWTENHILFSRKKTNGNSGEAAEARSTGGSTLSQDDNKLSSSKHGPLSDRKSVLKFATGM